MQFYDEIDGKVVVTTSTGHRVECQPVAAQLNRVGLMLEEPTAPKPPTYTVVDVAGEEVQYPHTADTITGEETTDEEREAWGAYLEAKAEHDARMAELDARRNEMKARFLALEGVKILDLPDLGAWAERQRSLFGIPVPDDPDQRLFEYAVTHVFPHPDDGYRIAAGIVRASGVDREVMDSIEATFQRSMGRADGQDAGEHTEDIGT